MPLYAKTTSSAIDIKALQIGTKRQIPIYETTTTTKTGPTCNYANLNEYFTVTQGSSYGWTLSENTSSVKLAPSNFGIHSSTATVTLTAKRNISNLVITGAYYTESNWDKITLTVAGSTKLNAVSGTSALATRVSGVSMTTGQTVVFIYEKDSSGNASSESSTYFTLTCDPYTETVTEEVITGYVEKLLPTNIIGAWIYKDSSAFQFFGGTLSLEYTGDHIILEIEDDKGNLYDLYVLTSAGSLTLNTEVQAWLCGGGAGGGNSIVGTGSGYYAGGGGGGGYITTGNIIKGKYITTIGAGGASANNGVATSILNEVDNSIILTADGGKTPVSTTYGIYNTKHYCQGGLGGSGGGAGRYKVSSSNYSSVAGTGAGITTIPFDLADELDNHCAGGGGGSVYGARGGAGGSNGSNGSGSTTGTGISFAGGVGGARGGGNGGSVSNAGSGTSGGNATYYGSGGGGAGISNSALTGGAGYQGIIYLLAPKTTPADIASNVNCTGSNTTSIINIDGQNYNLMTITDSGTLKIGSGSVKVWMCGGGGGGYGSKNGYGTTSTGVSGGGGGGGYVGNTILNKGEYIITIGKGAAPTYSENTSQGTSSTIIRNNTTLLNCLGGNSASYHSYPLAGSGGSGGGSGAYGMGYSGRTGAGANVSTYPFNIISLQAHCAGGGGGGLQFNNSNDGTSTKGGDGGSNGSSGKTTTSNTGSNTPGGSGGIYGGGNGGVSLDSSISVSEGYAAGNGTNGTFYGAGGGGGGRVVWYSGGSAEGKGGTGYQGVCYVLWRKS